MNYFRVGNAARCFGFVKEWVETKFGTAPSDAREGPWGFRLSWKQWSTARIYTELGVFTNYRVRYQVRA